MQNVERRYTSDAVEMLLSVEKNGVSYQGRYAWSGKGEFRSKAFSHHRDAARHLLDMILNELIKQ